MGNASDDHPHVRNRTPGTIGSPLLHAWWGGLAGSTAGERRSTCCDLRSRPGRRGGREPKCQPGGTLTSFECGETSQKSSVSRSITARAIDLFTQQRQFVSFFFRQHSAILAYRAISSTHGMAAIVQVEDLAPRTGLLSLGVIGCEMSRTNLRRQCGGCLKKNGDVDVC